jgi:hypothetical protein
MTKKGGHLSPEARTKLSSARKGQHNSLRTEFKKGHEGRRGAENPATWPHVKIAMSKAQKHRYEGHRVEVACPYCGRINSLFLAEVKRGAKFCPGMCYQNWLREYVATHKDEWIKKSKPKSDIKPNVPEQKVLNILNTYFPNDWQYTGDGRVIIGGMKPDFMNINGKKAVVEVFGDYWHSQKVRNWRETEVGRLMAYGYWGFRCLVIWEYELDKLPEGEIVRRIRRLVK